jgi:hypothetical protein
MKCIRCGHDSKKKDRDNRTCPNCKGKFAFEPQDRDPVTDMLFLNAIKAVSADGKIRWGVEHLYYEICRRKRGFKAPWALIFILLALAGFLLGYVVINKPKASPPMVFFALFLLIATAISIASRFRGPFARVDLETFNRLWERWRAVHGVTNSLIQRAPEQELPKDLEADIGDYSFDRAVICDRARTVDLLVANNFHFENNCAVVSIAGYPKAPFPVIKKMLKRNPRLQVFVLHDATIAGCKLAHRLISDPDWFGGSGLRVIDLGLRPRHAGPFKGLLLEGPGTRLDPGEGIFENETEWLQRYKLELAACRPEQVIKRLFAGLQAHANDDPRTADSAGAVTTCGAFDAGGYGGDGDGGSDGGADAFG